MILRFSWVPALPRPTTIFNSGALILTAWSQASIAVFKASSLFIPSTLFVIGPAGFVGSTRVSAEVDKAPDCPQKTHPLALEAEA